MQSDLSTTDRVEFTSVFAASLRSPAKARNTECD